MTISDRVTPGADTGRPARGAMMRGLPFRDLAPVMVASAGVVAFAGAALGSVLHHRILEMDQTALARRTIQPSPPAASLALAPQGFTLAPDEVRSLAPDDARAFNSGIAFSTLPILAARPFIMAPDDIQQYGRALDCMTAAIYYEAASETAEGQAAVAQVVLNRMHHPAYPNTVCGVVFQGAERTTGCQFSFTCDGAMARVPSVAGWSRARATASAALNGSVATGVGMATHYHTDWVAPYWSSRLVKMRQIGTHIFYRWSGSWGLPFAFSRKHGGIEPVIAKMSGLATLTEEAPVAPAPELLDAPAPVLVVTHTQTDDPSTPTAPVLPRVETVAQEPAAAQEAIAAPPPPRPVAVADPLSSPVQAPPRRRSRIAAPSGW